MIGMPSELKLNRVGFKPMSLKEREIFRQSYGKYITKHHEVLSDIVAEIRDKLKSKGKKTTATLVVLNVMFDDILTIAERGNNSSSSDDSSSEEEIVVQKVSKKKTKKHVEKEDESSD